jgi:uncharacterized membrane protein YdjX (TVP38/TMEM64 family)
VTVVLAALAVSGRAHPIVAAWIEAAKPYIAAHAVGGAFVFAAAAAVSAMLVFVSSLILVPLGVAMWGKATCFALLWIGWLAGGCLSYGIGRFFGRPAVRHLLSAATFDRYESRIPRNAPFRTALIVQLTVPSDVAGYFFGTLAYPFRRYVAAIALAELPFAAGTVFVGAAFVERSAATFIIAIAVVLLVVLFTWRRGHAESA